MRLRFADPDLQQLYEDEDFHVPKYGADLVKAYRKKVAVVDSATDLRDLRAMKSLHFEKLVGDRAGQHSIRINMKWRLVLKIESDIDGQAVAVIEIVDYH